MKALIAFAALLAVGCGGSLPVFERGDYCSCFRDVGVPGVDGHGGCLSCQSAPDVGSNDAGFSVHTNRCSMQPISCDAVK